jgi:exosortase A-associated hydrolase 2
MIPSSAPPPQPFFLNAGAAARFCLYHPAAQPCRGSWLYVHPFAEELNKSRRMAALQARSMAQNGYAVLQVDLYGCGDSAGDFGDAGWDAWHEDLRRASAWLAAATDTQPGLWGLRLGASLAVDYSRSAPTGPAGLLLWQPVCQGAQYLRQFLRLKIASNALEQNAAAGVNAMLQSLREGLTLEIAGYRLSPVLAEAIGALDLGALPPAMPAHWIEIGPQCPPAAQRIRDAWQAAGTKLQFDLVDGPPFWATQEITECPALLSLASCHAC